jgi:tetratricopeptide (TPR) repeat protein
LAISVAATLAASPVQAGPEPEVGPDVSDSEPPDASAGVEGPSESADDRTHAKRAFEDGLAAVAAERYDIAIASFERAYELRPHPVTLFNLALALEKAGRRPEAWGLFDAVLDIVESDGERREIRERLRVLEAQIAIVEIEASPRHRLCIDGFAMPRGKLDGYQIAVEPGVHPLLLDEHEFPLSVEPGDRRVVLLEGAERFIEGERRSPVVPGMLGLAIGSSAAAIGLGVGAAVTHEPPPLRTGLAAGAAGSAGLAVIAGVVALALELRERRGAGSGAGTSTRASHALHCPSTSPRIDLELLPQVRRPAAFASLPTMPIPDVQSVPRLRGIRPPRRSELADQQQTGPRRDHGDAALQSTPL